MHNFEPTLEAAQARLAEVEPDAYARTRNALDGAVTRLSPYITHGLLSPREVYSAVHARHPLDARHKLVFELGWRAYWRHVWHHRGDGIHCALHAGPLPDIAYQRSMPDDVVEASTGVPAIDHAVRELYANGYLHNHARLWLASYLVHLRKVHWHTGAAWMLGHLLDGDVASNHLSWQWVAGTGSRKPYLFNADNVAKYAPAQWHSPGTAIDASYEALDHCARSAAPVCDHQDNRPVPIATLPPALQVQPDDPAWSAPDPSIVANRDVFLLHPWSLGASPPVHEAPVVLIGVGFSECHLQMPWSPQRWRFVTAGLQARTSTLWWGSAQQVAQALQGALSVRWYNEPHATAVLDTLHAKLRGPAGASRTTAYTPECLFEPVHTYCPSFSHWWRQTRIAR